jgi:hypothetical protein
MIRSEDPKLLNEYFSQIGRIAVAAGHLEETIIQCTATLCDASKKPHEVHAKMLFRGMAANISTFKRTMKRRVSSSNLEKLLVLLESISDLNKLRNEFVHASWSSAHDANTGDFVGVSRTRYTMSESRVDVDWDVRTPTLEEVRMAADQIFKLVENLETWFANVWRSDERVAQWYAEKISN